MSKKLLVKKTHTTENVISVQPFKELVREIETSMYVGNQTHFDGTRRDVCNFGLIFFFFRILLTPAVH